jgi:2,4-dienoyl-CoA reductase-like NADH-dependent reductase (Old Yellow Enzyme family)
MSPMTRGFSPGGIPGRDVAEYYRRRAQGEVGLIVTEGIGIDHPAALGSAGLGEKDIPELHGKAALTGWRRVVDAVHAEGGTIIPQLWHQGPMREGGGPHPEAPSCRPSGIWGAPAKRTTVPRRYVERMLVPTRPMTTAEIEDVVGAFARSAGNARDVGFDGVAIHGAHGYLVDAFLWSVTNRRRDRYGRGLSGRTRFPVEVVEAIRREIGPDLPIVFRLSQWKQQDVHARIARTPLELERILIPLVEAGVDVFDASTRRFDGPAFDGSDLTLAGWIKKITGVHTMCVGGVGLEKDLYDSLATDGSATTNNLPQVADRVRSGEFDLIGVGRMLLVDPDWARKVRAGEPVLAFGRDALETLD